MSIDRNQRASTENSCHYMHGNKQSESVLLDFLWVLCGEPL